MKQNSCPIIGEVAKPSGVGLDELNSAIESFGAGIADSVPTVVEQTGLMAPEHPDYFFDRLQTAAHGVAGPCVKETFGRPRVVIAPEPSECFFDAPCPAGLEIELVQSPKRNRLGRTPIRIGFEPRILAACQRRRARLRQTAVFLFAHRIDRLAEIFGNVKPVMHDVGLGNTGGGRTYVSRPHIHRDRFDLGALGRAECFQQTLGRFQLALRHQVKHARAVNVGQYADVAVPSFGTFFINPKMGYRFLVAAQHASFHSAHHDVVDGTPGKSRERAHPFGGGANLQQLDYKSFHQQGDPAVAVSPGNGQLFDCAVAVFELWYTRFDEGLKLASVQVSPPAFGPAIDVGSFAGVRGVSPHLAGLENNFNHHALLGQRKVNKFHRPGRFQSKKVFVQGSVFHVVVGEFEKPYSLTSRKISQ